MEEKDKNYCQQIFFFDEGVPEKKLDNTLTTNQAVDIVNKAILSVNVESGLVMDLEILRDWLKNR